MKTKQEEFIEMVLTCADEDIETKLEEFEERLSILEAKIEIIYDLIYEK